MAEAICSKIVNEKKIDWEVKSCGMKLDLMRPYVAENVLNALKEKGYEVDDEKSREIDDNLIDWADFLTITADNVNLESFDGRGKMVVVWEIGDCDESEMDCIRKVVEDVEKRVRDFVELYIEKF